jgi:nitrogen-specific signal transduction histidine kinase
MPDGPPISHTWRDAGFDELCHDLKNPLMVIRGRAQLIERVINQSVDLPDAERARILHGLAVIDEAVVGIVEMIDDTRPSQAVGTPRESGPLLGPRSP